MRLVATMLLALGNPLAAIRTLPAFSISLFKRSENNLWPDPVWSASGNGHLNTQNGIKRPTILFVGFMQAFKNTCPSRSFAEHPEKRIFESVNGTESGSRIPLCLHLESSEIGVIGPFPPIGVPHSV